MISLVPLRIQDRPAWPSNKGENAAPRGLGVGERWLASLAVGFAAWFAMALASTAHAEQVICHYTYGGETRQWVAMPVLSPYGVKSIAVGSYFHLRVVFQKEPADLASIKVYTYADGDDGPVPVHQATYPYPPPRTSAARYGFTGLHWVYEPTRDGELEYWCQLSGRAGKRNGGSK